jgi:ADP-heptose:LPS heptosyltransferase
VSSLISHTQLQSAQRILYMTHLAIGDFVYQSVWLKALKAKYPHLVIDVWFDNCRSRPQSWATGRNKVLNEWIDALGIIDNTYPIVGNLAQRQGYIKQAQALNYDLIVFIGKNRSEQFAKIARKISPSAYVVASKSKPLSNPLAKWLYFKNIDAHFSYDDIAKRSKHITDLYSLCFERALGLTCDDLVDGKKQLVFNVDDVYQQQARILIEKLTQNDNNKLIVFVNHLSTADKRDYPFAQLKQVILGLEKKYQNLVYIFNCPPDKLNEVTTQVAEDSDLNRLAVTTFTAKQNFFQLPALIAESNIVISAETATAHLAVCMDKPQVTIMSNNLTLWQPKGDCIILTGSGQAKSITPQQIVDAFTQQLNQHFSGTSKLDKRP